MQERQGQEQLLLLFQTKEIKKYVQLKMINSAAPYDNKFPMQPANNQH